MLQIVNYLRTGTRGGTRTPKPVKAPDPKSGVSTNFTTLANFIPVIYRAINYQKERKNTDIH